MVPESSFSKKVNPGISLFPFGSGKEVYSFFLESKGNSSLIYFHILGKTRMIVLSICICEMRNLVEINKQRKQSIHAFKTTSYVGKLILRPEHLLKIIRYNT